MMRTLQEQSVSVVIPTLNAAAPLAATLGSLAASPLVTEIVVADGGSGDNTRAIARDAGARVVAGPRGRGQQLAAGAAAAAGGWLLFVHADCRPEPGWDKCVAKFITGPAAAARAGYFEFALDDAAAAARRLERVVAWRCRLFSLPFGDQGLLIARSLYEEIGGYRPLPLMEDVDIVRRLGRRRLAPLGPRLYSSAHRYRHGYLRRSARNLLCLSLYAAGVSPGAIVRLYG